MAMARNQASIEKIMSIVEEAEEKAVVVVVYTRIKNKIKRVSTADACTMAIVLTWALLLFCTAGDN